jgi:hypothetical protein
MGALLHDHAMAIAAAILDVFSPLLREEEKRTAFDEVYERVKAGLIHYEMHADRREQRLRPMPN